MNVKEANFIHKYVALNSLCLHLRRPGDYDKGNIVFNCNKDNRQFYVIIVKIILKNTTNKLRILI